MTIGPHTVHSGALAPRNDISTIAPAMISVEAVTNMRQSNLSERCPTTGPVMVNATAADAMIIPLTAAERPSTSSM